MRVPWNNLRNTAAAIFGIVGVFFFFVTAVGAFEKIDQFKADIRINADGSLEITETIRYDFADNFHHGIYRDIPVSYRARGGTYRLDLEVISVTDATRQPYRYTVSRVGRDLQIKIGDPDTTITGQHTYVIAYRVSGALNYFDDHDELYWNITGNNWEVPIVDVSADIFLPQPLAESMVQRACFAGPYGSSVSCNLTALHQNQDVMITGVRFREPILQIADGLTVVVGFPKGIVYQPTPLEVALKMIFDNWIVGLPLVTFFVLLYLWRRFGRDPKGRETIIAQYEPPTDVSPSQAGALMDERVDSRDISADIINLAIKGYLKIIHVDDTGILDRFSKNDNYIFQQLKDESGLKNDFERELLKSVFKSSYIKTHDVGGKKIQGVELSKLKNKFYKDLQEIRKQIYRSLVAKHYFIKNPQTIRTMYLIIGSALLFLIPITAGFFGGIGTIALLISAALVIVFSFIMPQKTRDGVLAKEHILGLREYLTVAEKDRIKFHNAPEKKPEVFETLLPYAMVLKVEDQWAKQFADIYHQQPGWYYDPSGRAFSAIYLTNSLSDFSAITNKALASNPRSAAGGGSGFGGGGFGGGGFGGGGGGSW